MLLLFPPELLRHILHVLDPEAFYACTLTCKTFRNHALNSTSLLKDQLARLPGRRDDYSDASAESLLRMFGQASTRHLYHRPHADSDVHLFRPPEGAKLDWKNTTIVSCNCASSKHLALLEVCKTDAIVRFHAIDSGGSSLKSDCRPKLKYILSPPKPEHPKVGRLEVAKVTLTRHGFHELYHMEDDEDPCIDRIAVVYRQYGPDGILPKLRVAIFGLDPEIGAVLTDDLKIYSPEILLHEMNPVAFAVGSNDMILAVFRHYKGGNPRSTLRRFSKDKHGFWFSDGKAEFDTEMEHPDDIISDIRVKGSHAHYLSPTLPVSQWWTPNYSNELVIQRRDNNLPDDVEPFSASPLGEFLRTYHQHKVRSSEDGSTFCVNTALTLMLSRNEPSRTPFTGSYYDHDDLNTRTGAFLLKAVDYPPICEPLSPTTRHDLSHVYVARLSSIDLTSLSSLGILLTISPQANRIALANWKTVYVYSIAPEAFLDPKESLPNAEEDLVPGDHAYLEGCGWRYYANCEREGEMVVIRPVELPSMGVVKEMRFIGEDELWAWTERGLVRWGFGCSGMGRKEVSLLE